jgi:hypothetical protein
VIGIDREPVAAGAAQQPPTSGTGGQRRLEQPAQQADMPVYDIDRARWRVGAPQHVD